MRLIRTGVLLILINSVAMGCGMRATVQNSTPLPGFDIGSGDHLPLKIAVVQAPTDARIKEFKSISSEIPPKEKETEKALIAEKLREAQDHAQTFLIESLDQKAPSFVLKDADTRALIDSLNLANNDEAIPLEVLEKFREMTQADAVLRFRITDYGATPRSLLNWIYIGTGAWIAAVVTLAATKPKTRPYIGVYVGTEVLQEGSEIFLGVSLFEYFYKPVRIEAELIDARSGKILWKDAKTKSASGRRRERQLSVATERAVDALVRSLMGTLGPVETSAN